MHPLSKKRALFNDKKYYQGVIMDQAKNGLKWLLIMFAICLTNGCAQHYNKIDFCWTTNHRIPPNERMISVNATPLSAKNALVKWALLHSGEVVTEKNDYGKIITLHPDSSKKFQMAHDIAEKKWNSYERNEFLKWGDGEFDRLQQFSETQIEVAPSPQTGWKLFVKIGKREGQVNVRKRAGYQTVYVPGFFSPKGVWVQPNPIKMPRYEIETKTLIFYSIVRFFIFENEGKTFIYVYALPEEGKLQVKASYGNSIGHKWHKYIDARQEAEFVGDAFSYLQTLDHLGKLQEFENKQ